MAENKIEKSSEWRNDNVLLQTCFRDSRHTGAHKHTRAHRRVLQVRTTAIGFHSLGYF